MKKIIISLMLILSLLTTGCVVHNRSDEFCTLAQHSNSNDNISVYLDGEFCVIEDDNNKTKTSIIHCSNFIGSEEINVIIKSNESITEKEIDESINLRCELATY